MVALLPVPIKRDGRLQIAGLHLWVPTALPSIPREEIIRRQNEVPAPSYIHYVDASTGASMGVLSVQPTRGGPAHFGIPAPPDGVVGHFNDPAWPPKERREALRARILSALDVLLPLFVDQNRPWTEDANKAAQEVRDFFPVAAEPGLWPYYKAEGREFFAWVERNAPPAKARLPWE